MMSAVAISKARELLLADTALTTLLGGQSIYKSKSLINIQIPGVYWSLVSEFVGENLSEVVIQFDIAANGFDLAAQIEARVYGVLHSDDPISVSGGMKLWGMMLTARDGEGSDQGNVMRSVEYRLTLARAELGTW